MKRHLPDNESDTETVPLSPFVCKQGASGLELFDLYLVANNKTAEDKEKGNSLLVYRSRQKADETNTNLCFISWSDPTHAQPIEPKPYTTEGICCYFLLFIKKGQNIDFSKNWRNSVKERERERTLNVSLLLSFSFNSFNFKYLN